MNYQLLNFLILSFQISLSIHLSIREKHGGVYLENFVIQSGESEKRLPNNFRITLNSLGKQLSANFDKVENYVLPDITHSINGGMRKIYLSDNNDHQTYRDLSGRAFATLYFRNGELRMV